MQARVFFVALLAVAVRADYPFMNTDLSWKDRVDDLVGRMTLEEVQGQLAYGSDKPAPAIPRLGIQKYQWWSNCGRGYVGAPGDATAFPQAIGLAATFDRNLRYRVAEAGAIEGRAKHTQYVKQGNFGIHTGLSCFSPNVDLLRHPFWGRNQETTGEDPYMARVYADYFIRGLQGDHPRYIRMNAGCKHFAMHSGPENSHNGGHNRASFDSKVSMYDMRMSYLPGFRQCAESGTYSYMSSYNAVNGVPVVANKWLLTDLIRGEWNFTGYVLADYGAMENMVNSFHYRNNRADACAAALNAGLNIDCPSNKDQPSCMTIVDSVHNGKLSEHLVRERVKPLFYTRMRLGEFDPPQYNPYTYYKMDVVESESHRKLAVEAAMKSFVLLKNKNNVLPLSKNHYDNVALVGPFADETDNLYGNYAPNTNSRYKTNVEDGIRHIATNVHKARGCNDPNCQHYDSSSVVNQLHNVDLIFVALGTGQAVESEGHDKYGYDLPGHQEDLVHTVLDNAHGTPVIVLLFTGSQIDIGFIDGDDRVSAIVECFLPAQATGDAIRHMLLNDVDGAVPAGRLPVTWWHWVGTYGDINDYDLRQGDGKTYRYYKGSGDPLYPFGYGLSYTTFRYSDLNFDHNVQAGHDLHGTVVVHNEGHLDADEAVQVYISWGDHNLPAPVRQLSWFDRVRVPKGGQKTVKFTVEAKTMALWINNGWKISGGSMKIYAGGQQPNQKRNVGSNVLEGTFNIQGSKNLHSLIG